MIPELLLLFGVMLALLALGLPVFFAMALASTAYAVAFWPKMPAMVVGQSLMQGLDSYSYAAIAFFFLAGEVMNAGGISRRLLRLARALIGHLRGGLSHVNVVASMVFAGVSGSAVADASAIGSVMIPAMKAERYPAAYSAAVTAASATIGPMIPPSIPLVVYGLFAGVSVGRLFLAGVLPGLGMGLVLLVASVWISRRRGYPTAAWQGWRELAAATASSLLALAMPAIVVIGLVSGIATTTEIGAVAAVYAIVVSVLVYRELSLPALARTLARAGLDAGKVLIVISVAGSFTWIIANMGLARAIAGMLTAVDAGPTAVLGLIALLLLALGTILEPVTLLVVVVPMLLPGALAVGIDLVQLGIVAVLATLIGLITPPVGILIYLTAAQAEAPALAVVRESLPFLLALIALLAAAVLWPGLSLWLPGALMG